MYCCGKCRRPVALASCLSGDHDDDGTLLDGCGVGLLNYKKVKEGKGACSSIFLAGPLEWMKGSLGLPEQNEERKKDEEEEEEGEQRGFLSGKLYCPKCKSKLGSFDWAGSKCSCGKWVTPAFQVQKNRVDLRKVNAARASAAGCQLLALSDGGGSSD